MKYKKEKLVILLGVIMILNGCSNSKKTEQNSASIDTANATETNITSEKEQIVENKEKIDMLIELLGCDELHAKGIENTFQDATQMKMEDIELIPTTKKTKFLKVKAEDKVYYLKVSSLFLLIEIREDTEDGKVIFQVNY